MSVADLGTETDNRGGGGVPHPARRGGGDNRSRLRPFITSVTESVTGGTTSVSVMHKGVRGRGPARRRGRRRVRSQRGAAAGCGPEPVGDPGVARADRPQPAGSRRPAGHHGVGRRLDQRLGVVGVLRDRPRRRRLRLGRGRRGGPVRTAASPSAWPTWCPQAGSPAGGVSVSALGVPAEVAETVRVIGIEGGRGPRGRDRDRSGAPARGRAVDLGVAGTAGPRRARRRRPQDPHRDGHGLDRRPGAGGPLRDRRGRRGRRRRDRRRKRGRHR